MMNEVMKRVPVLIGLLSVVAVAGVWAEEKTLFRMQTVPPTVMANFAGIDPLANGGGGDYSGGERARMIALNFLFGAGSYSAGRISHGITLTLLQAGGIALLVLPSVLGLEGGLSEKGKENVGKPSSGSSSNNQYYDDNLTPETNAMIWMYVGGGALLITDIVLNIYWPLQYQRAPTANRTASLANPQNWGFSLFPDQSGNLAGNLSFTARF